MESCSLLRSVADGRHWYESSGIIVMISPLVGSCSWSSGFSFDFVSSLPPDQEQDEVSKRQEAAECVI